MSKPREALSWENPLTILRAVRDAWIPNKHALAVLIMLILHADENGHCHPAQDLLALETGISPDAVSDAINWLAANHLLLRKRRYRKSNYYALSITRDTLHFDDYRNGHQPSHAKATSLRRSAHRTAQRDRKRPIWSKCIECGEMMRTLKRPSAAIHRDCERIRRAAEINQGVIPLLSKRQK